MMAHITVRDVQRSAELVAQGAPGSLCPISAGGTHVTMEDVVRPVLDDIITLIEQQEPELTHVPHVPVTCELITCIEAGVCDCERPFKVVASVGKKWAEGGVRQWITHKVHSTAWQHKHDPKLFAPPTALGFDPDCLTAIEDQWNARKREGYGQRKQRKKTARRIKLPQQDNRLPFKLIA